MGGMFKQRVPTDIFDGRVLFPFSLLASGSDDVTAILWDPYQHKAMATMQTGHTGNIFSVKVRIIIVI